MKQMSSQVENGTSTIIASREVQLSDIPVHLQIEAVSFSSPEKTAVIDHLGNPISYELLMQKAKQVSNYLYQLGIREEHVVALQTSISNFNTIAGILGIFGAGATLLPLSADQPEEMISFMLKDSGAHCILCEDPVFFQQEKGYLSVPFHAIYQEASGSFDLKSNTSAYIIYTSGSTGKPKGVKVTHSGVANLCSWYRTFCSISSSGRTLLMVPFTSDAAYKNVFATLTAGGTLIMSTRTNYHPLAILHQIEQQSITHINCVPRAIYQVLALARRNAYKSLQSLQALILGGEAMDPAIIKSWFCRPDNRCRLFNVYGPTECTDIAIATEVTCSQLVSDTPVPIGIPIRGIHAYVVNTQGDLQEENTTGELWLSGIGVANGYINNPVLTSANFIPSPFSEGGMIYRTGDICSRDCQGILTYHGRADRQIKIKGLRVEPAEIEHCLKAFPGIVEAVVIPGQITNESFNLKAFVVIETGKQFDRAACQGHLRTQLPAHIVPKIIVPIDSIPIQPNGKTDLSSLKFL